MSLAVEVRIVPNPKFRLESPLDNGSTENDELTVVEVKVTDGHIATSRDLRDAI